jgi:ADP-ribose pyrophosphatase
MSNGEKGDGPRARRLSSRRIYTGKVLSLDVDEVEEPGGVHARREVVRHSGSVAVLAIQDDGKIVLVRQYRYPVDDFVWELPAGRLDPGRVARAGGPARAAGRDRLQGRQLQKMAFFHTTPGFCDESMHVFRATGLLASKAQGDEDERIEVQAFTLSELEAMIDRGEIREGKTLVAILLERRRPA